MLIKPALKKPAFERTARNLIIVDLKQADSSCLIERMAGIYSCIDGTLIYILRMAGLISEGQVLPVGLVTVVKANLLGSSETVDDVRRR